MKMSSSQNYEMLTQREHVMKRPDTYIGSCEITTETRWVYHQKNNKMIRKKVKYNPGLEQCVMELITNATDRTQDPSFKVSKIDVTVSEKSIEVKNDGLGIPIEKHKKHGIYIPEMIFGNMLAGSNFDDTKKRTVGGKNGIGSKACNIFSNSFKVVTVYNKQKYEQTFTNRMVDKTKPKITKVKSKDYTLVSFEPCLEAFGMKDLHENDTVMMIHKRVVDASAITPKKVSVSFNGKSILVKDFQDYMNLYIGPKSETPRVYVDHSERWTIGFALNPHTTAMQISFVNGICTEEGGTHVSHIIEPVLNRVVKELQEKHKELTIRKHYIRDNIIIFVKSIIEDPTFNSQTKKMHTTQITKFGSRVILKDETIKKIIKLGIAQGVIEIARAKELKGLSRTDGRKKVRLSGIPKLDDANWAGTSKSKMCTLLLTEGDSAASTAIAGTSVVGKDTYGVFPLKGKLLNTREASPAKIGKNEEIVNINKILGLEHGKKYDKDMKGLRYGKIMIMTDQDVDGFHITSLLINYLSCFWPELLGSNFVCSLLTPVIKIFKGSTTRNFYDLVNYEEWKNGTPDSNRWRVKYYKGLGTSTSQEAKEYFRNLGTNKRDYTFEHKPQSKDQKALELAFTDSKKINTDKRKEWITQTLKKKPKVDYNIKTVTINDYIRKELVQFSIYDNERSLPHVIDGLKISQRKILYSCLKRKLFLRSDGSGEIKVAQLAGYVSEHSAYHHGEASLHGAIVNMAQDFVGSGNNMNLLYPSGQFGSRIQAGKDSASPRYIFTYLNKWVDTMYNQHDNHLLNYLDDDGNLIEPEFYVPVLPMILVNGSDGIGTGWSTTVPSFNPKDIIGNLKKLISNEDAVMDDMDPWYKGFKGKITKIEDNEWRAEGIIDVNRQSKETIVKVTELPVGTIAQSGKKWIQDFKNYLDLMEQRDEILSYVSNSTDENVSFKVTFRTRDVKNYTDYEIMSRLKLIGTIRTSNMHAFDPKGCIKKYESAEEILWEFFTYRKKFYRKRKKYLVDLLTNQLEKISEKARFIRMVIDEKIVVFKRKKADIVEDLESHSFGKIDGNFNHLLDIRIHAFTLEKLNVLEEQIKDYSHQLGDMKRKTIQDIWIGDIDKLESSTDSS